jgi:ribosomal protein S18 acetylase RimI-like enzyme
MSSRLSQHFMQSQRLIRDTCGNPFSLRLYQPEGDDYRSLTVMYQGFEPKERSQGLPARLEQQREGWLRYMMEEGINLLAVIEEKVVGHAALFKMEHDTRCEFLIFVHQDYQDRGIGSALTEMIKELAQELGFEQIWLTVQTSNVKAIRMYEKVGFRITESPDIECVMMLSLQKKTLETT